MRQSSLRLIKVFRTTKDIMTHFLEQYLSPSKNTLVLDGIKEGQLKAVIEAGNRVKENPSDYDARSYLRNFSITAGKAADV